MAWDAGTDKGRPDPSWWDSQWRTAFVEGAELPAFSVLKTAVVSRAAALPESSPSSTCL